jgi:2-isopropylmalate synthase
MTNHIRFFDTTLRDGEQSPGFSMSEAGKMKMAKALAALQVDVIEAGFAAASPGDSAAIQRIAEEVEGPTICSLSRCVPNDILAAAKSLEPAKKKRIHVFLGTSPLHREFKLKMTEAEILNRIKDMVEYARQFADDIEFSAEDAIRTETGFLIEALSTAAHAGATTLNVPDTVGYTTPDEIYQLFKTLNDKVDRAHEVIFSAHCHDDLGMAVANSLAAVRGGARQVECTINGIGERAGNAALEDIAMTLRTRKDAFGLDHQIETTEIMNCSRTLSQVTNTHPPRNKSIVGANAFAHESGIHQHGVLQKRETYEIMKPEDIGLESNSIVLGKHSGKHALIARSKQLGFELDGEALESAFKRFKLVADEVGLVDAARLTAILTDDGDSGEPDWKLNKLEIRSPLAANANPVARVELEHKTRGPIADLAQAPGAMDAAYQAISEIMDLPGRVSDIDMQYIADDEEDPVTGQQGAEVLVELTVEVDHETFAGRASARDIIPACASAYVDALNNALAVRRQRAAKIAAE